MQAEALTALLSSFPAPVRNMVAHTPPEVLLAAAVYIRPARSMPAALGKGRVALVGEAARPLRPSGEGWGIRVLFQRYAETTVKTCFHVYRKHKGRGEHRM
jgi:hypothetical protein